MNFYTSKYYLDYSSIVFIRGIKKNKLKKVLSRKGYIDFLRKNQFNVEYNPTHDIYTDPEYNHYVIFEWVLGKDLEYLKSTPKTNQGCFIYVDFSLEETLYFLKYLSSITGDYVYFFDEVTYYGEFPSDWSYCIIHNEKIIQHIEISSTNKNNQSRYFQRSDDGRGPEYFVEEKFEEYKRTFKNLINESVNYKTHKKLKINKEEFEVLKKNNSSLKEIDLKDYFFEGTELNYQKIWGKFKKNSRIKTFFLQRFINVLGIKYPYYQFHKYTYNAYSKSSPIRYYIQFKLWLKNLKEDILHYIVRYIEIDLELDLDSGFKKFMFGIPKAFWYLLGDIFDLLRVVIIYPLVLLLFFSTIIALPAFIGYLLFGLYGVLILGGVGLWLDLALIVSMVRDKRKKK